MDTAVLANKRERRPLALVRLSGARHYVTGGPGLNLPSLCLVQPDAVAMALEAVGMFCFFRVDEMTDVGALLLVRLHLPHW